MIKLSDKIKCDKIKRDLVDLSLFFLSLSHLVYYLERERQLRLRERESWNERERERESWNERELE